MSVLNFNLSSCPVSRLISLRTTIPAQQFTSDPLALMPVLLKVGIHFVTEIEALEVRDLDPFCAWNIETTVIP